MLTLYARQEPTTDSILLKYYPNTKKKDTVFYRDKECKDTYGRWSWNVSGRPTRRKTVTLNCYKWRIKWVK
jgi:hypothetical protein